MAMIKDALRESQIRSTREKVYAIDADIDKIIKDIHGVDGIEVIGEILKEKFRIDFFRYELSFNQLQSLIAIFCNEIYVVYNPVTGDYSLNINVPAAMRNEVELDDKDSYKLEVVGMEDIEGGVTEIDFSDVRRDLMWYAMSTSVRSPNRKKTEREIRLSRILNFFRKLKNR